MKKFLFVCGGTGGHIFPAVAIANSLKKMGVTDITFAGRKDSMEERLVAKDWPYEYISAVPLHRGPFLKNLALPFNLSKALIRAKSVIKKVKPDVVVATGGYVSLPIVIAAGTAGIPVYLQEQNAVAGVANKVGSRYAKTVFVTSEDAAKFFPEGRCMIFGNPVRELPAEDTLPRPAEFAPGKKAVFIVGGSQGAVGINNKIEDSIKTIAARDDVSVVWQVGVKNVESISSRVGEVKNVAIRGFLDGIYSYMKHADLIISRAGASALAEILAFGKPSILLPFPHATANHQEHNARVVEKAGAALVELDSDENHLWEKVEQLLGDETRLNAMAAAAMLFSMFTRPGVPTRISRTMPPSHTRS
jgi:UDP-N-acetylglucosamine--N-acetylmuramyl-(pentapeptide) pyrophosphoryl-undecaprenol N-acetylglucosamine transferase